MVEKCRRFRLRNGRWLAYSQYGASRGKPILYFHGWPGSRLEARVADQTAKEFNATLIAIDRPGFGMSDFQPGRAILDWPADVSEIADALRLERFAIAGISGGGPYALACALRIPERLTSVAIICGVGPTEGSGAMEGMSPFARRVFYLCRKAPWLLRGNLCPDSLATGPQPRVVPITHSATPSGARQRGFDPLRAKTNHR
jgi:pimeloyl-ACP methyl ester carboxylesterase